MKLYTNMGDLDTKELQRAAEYPDYGNKLPISETIARNEAELQEEIG